MPVWESIFIWLANRVPDYFTLRYIKAVLLRVSGVQLNPRGCYFVSPIHVDNPRKLSIGLGVFINRNCIFEGNGKVRIGRNVQIGPNVVFATTNHKLGKMEEVVGNIDVLENVWIGANVVVVQGVTIGPNVIVGAGAVITKDFAQCSVAGVPAVAIKSDPESEK